MDLRDYRTVFELESHRQTFAFVWAISLRLLAAFPGHVLYDIKYAEAHVRMDILRNQSAHTLLISARRNPAKFRLHLQRPLSRAPLGNLR